MVVYCMSINMHIFQYKSILARAFDMVQTAFIVCKSLMVLWFYACKSKLKLVLSFKSQIVKYDLTSWNYSLLLRRKESKFRFHRIQSTPKSELFRQMSN